ncbi:Lipase 5 [Conoideocrella luteorostrata]|uniref:Patatin-like phospholipase domain-containing protein n=1 Tax=Conoideocrella luteorostrata TaxID=1105319 RepID=A0AAJ0FWV2_9HYPO|nr:Lipase 5 [Conoideocrella luteorostrata]
MADLLVQAHKAPSRHGTEPKTASPTETKTERLSTHAYNGRTLRKAVSRTLRDANDAILSWKDGLTATERERIRLRDERKSVLSVHMKAAETYAQWTAAASELDTLDGNDKWKKDTTTGEYDFLLIQERLRALDAARLNGDIRAMMHLVRTELSRDLGGMNNVDLYRHSYVGTKKLIERYVDSAIQTIDALVSQSAVKHHNIEVKDLLEAMLFSRQSFGRSALLLSGGGTFGMTHIGVLKALFEQQLLPRIISGASAGSIVCAVMCTKTDEEIPGLIAEFPYGDLAVFEEEDSNVGVLGHLRRLLTEGSWSNIENLTRVMRGLMGDMTFQEAYNRTRRILNICVSTASIYELPRLLNYVTAPNVMIWSAVAASCSLPLVYTSSPLLVKDPVTGEHHPWTPTPQHFIDGSVDNDLPMTRLSEMFNVNHFIVCQVNPHVVPFLSKDDVLSENNRSQKASTPRSDDVDWAYTLSTLAREEALHRLQFMAELGIFPNLMTKCRAILSQKYSGDITILPEIAMNDLPRLLSNPTVDFMLRSCIVGERATWPRLSRIRDRCAIELALDRAVHSLRTRVVFSESQRNLRAMSTGMGNMHVNMMPTIASQSPTAAAVAGHSAASTGQVRRRRRSGGSVQTLPDGCIALDMVITDEETAAEERDELLSRGQTSSHSPTTHRKPRLKRSSKSVINVPQHKALPTSASTQHFNAIPEFNFSRPLRKAGSKSSLVRPSSSSHGEVRHMASTLWSEQMDRLARGEATSPTDDMETSELEHSSDEDAEQATEESDPDPYDSSVRNLSMDKARRNEHKRVGSQNT